MGNSEKLEKPLEIRIRLEPGCNGAPVIDDEGRLLGVIAGGSGNREINYAVPISTVRELIDAAGTGPSPGDGKHTLPHSEAA